MTQQSVHWLSLLIAIALCGGAILLTFLRWFCLVAALRFQFTIRDAMRLGFIGYLFNFVAPGSVGGDLVKAALLAKEQPDRRATAVATVLLDRILGMLALFMIGAGAAWWQRDAIQPRAELKAIVLLLAVGSVAGLVGLGLMMIPAVTQTRVVATGSAANRRPPDCRTRRRRSAVSNAASRPVFGVRDQLGGARRNDLIVLFQPRKRSVGQSLFRRMLSTCSSFRPRNWRGSSP